jgi:hypothetical protein
MRFVFVTLLIGHGVAHIVGFVVPWKLMQMPEMPYRTTILGGMMDVGDAGIRLMGVLWLSIGLAFAVVAGGVAAGWNMRAAVFALLALSSAFCVIGLARSADRTDRQRRPAGRAAGIAGAGRPLILPDCSFESTNLPIYQFRIRALASTIW